MVNHETRRRRKLDEWNGTFKLVDPRMVVIDHRYQRQEKPNLIAAIAASPDWAAFGALSLYERDNTLVCVDGQQRLRGILPTHHPSPLAHLLLFRRPPLPRRC